MDWDLLSFIKRSDKRIMILKHLDRAVIPSELAKNVNLTPSHISRTMKEFCDKGIAECKTNEKIKHGKIYVLSDKGKELLDDIMGGELADKYLEQDIKSK